jgi:hypothetical protein
MISRMRILAAANTVACADAVVRTIIDTYFSPNHSARELRDLVEASVNMDLLKNFSEAARQEVLGPRRL